MSNDNDAVIKVTKVSKHFKLPHEKVNSIKGLFTSIFRKRKPGYEIQKALDDINFEVKRGEFFGIVGRNGSGKSTLLKILAEIYQPSSGSVKVEGKLVPFIELGVGFNPQLTGKENIYLNGALLGFTKNEIDTMYDDIVEFAELERFMDQKLKNYSSGMQVRLAFSMATRAKADVLLVDEVLAVGDADFQRKCFNYFKQLKKQKTTVVFVTHDMASVREYCDRAILIEKSKLVLSGSADTVASEYIKLFQRDMTDQARQAKGDRWGDEKAKIMDITMEKNAFKDNDKEIEFTLRIKANEDLDAAVVGFSIDDASGRTLLGTNSLLLKQKIEFVKRGDVITTKWSIPNIFREGDYNLNVAVNHANGIDIHDWWHEAKEFKIYSGRYSQYIVNPPVAVEVTR